MIVKLVLESGWELPLALEDGVGERLLSEGPLVVRASKWKEEMYFDVGVDLEGGRLTPRVARGDVAYWPPGRALCVFYGLSQPYTPVRVVGRALGCLYPLRDVEDGSVARLEEYAEPEALKPVCELLRAREWPSAARRDEEGAWSVAFAIERGGLRLGFDLFVEDYGLYVESDAISGYPKGLCDLWRVCQVRSLLESRYELVRVDLNEDGMLCLTACCEPGELAAVIEELEGALSDLEEYLRAYGRTL